MLAGEKRNVECGMPNCESGPTHDPDQRAHLSFAEEERGFAVRSAVLGRMTSSEISE